MGLQSSPIWETARAMVPSARYEGATLETSQLSPQCCVCLLLAAFPGAHLRLWVPAPTTVGKENPQRHPLHTGELVCRKTYIVLSTPEEEPERTPFPASAVWGAGVRESGTGLRVLPRQTTLGKPECKSMRSSREGLDSDRRRCPRGRQDEREEEPWKGGNLSGPETCYLPAISQADATLMGTNPRGRATFCVSR